MDNTPTPQPHDGSPAAIAVNILHDATTKAFEAMGSAMLAITKNQKIMAAKIEELVVDRQKQVELVNELVQQIGVLQIQVSGATGDLVH